MKIGDLGSTVVKVLCYKSEGRWFDTSEFFIDIKSFRSHYEYQEYFLGVNAVGAYGDNLPPSCAVVTKSGNLNFLEPSGPAQACNGTAFFFNENLFIQITVYRIIASRHKIR